VNTNNAAVIVNSDEAILTLGQKREFNLNNDNFNDVSVELREIDEMQRIVLTVKCVHTLAPPKPEMIIATCNDGVQNCHSLNGEVLCEQGIDCGGPCSACPVIEEPSRAFNWIKEVYLQWVKDNWYITAIIFLVLFIVVEALYQYNKLKRYMKKRKREVVIREVEKEQKKKKRKNIFKSIFNNIASEMKSLKRTPGEKEIKIKKKEFKIKAKQRQKKLHEEMRKKHTSDLNEFLSKAVKRGFDKAKIVEMLVSKGWPAKFIKTYHDKFVELNKKELQKLKVEKIFELPEKEIPRKEPKRKRRTKEQVYKKEVDVLEDEVERIEKELRTNERYVRKELPKRYRRR